MWAPLIIEALLLCVLTGWLLHRLGSIKQMKWYVIVAVFVGWYFVFSVIVLLPNDISNYLHHLCLNQTEVDPQLQCDEPIAYVPNEFFYYAWRANYWTAFVFSWALGPILQSYVTAGGFTIWQKWLQAIKENLILYGVMAAVGVIALIVLGVQSNFDTNAIMGVVMALANVYGLVFVIFFLGHGLVDIPKKLWFHGNRDLLLKYYEFKAPGTKDTVDDTDLELLDTIRKINGLARSTPQSHEFRNYVDVIVAKCPPDREKYGVDTEFSKPDELTLKKLMSLNYRITEAIRFRHRADVLWHVLLTNAFHLQDVIKNRNNPSRTFTSDLWKKKSHTTRDIFFRKLEWYWHVRILPITLRILAVLAGLMSVIIVWCEVTMFSEQPILSVINLLVHVNINTFGTYIITFIIVGYMCLCAYSSLLKVRLFNYYYVVGNHQTDENSLLFSAAYLSRLTFPLTYNFSLMAGVDGTVFSQILGSMDFLALFGVGFSTYFPILVSVICLFVMFDVVGRVARLCNIQRFRHDDDDLSDSSISEGRELVTTARERAVRHPDLFFSGVTELPAERPKPAERKTPAAAKISSSINDDDTDGSSSSIGGRMGGFFNSLKGKAKGKGPVSKNDTALRKSLMSKSNTSHVAIEEEDDRENEIDTILDIEPVLPSYSSRIKRGGRPQNMFADI